MSLKYAILGFLDMEASTGYTLGQRFSGSVGSFWTATQSQIYRELHELEAKKLVVVSVVPQDGKPPRKLYSLTESGRQELAKLRSSKPKQMVMRDPFLLNFVFSAAEPPEKLQATLLDFKATLQVRRAEYESRINEPAIFSHARSKREQIIWELSIQQGIAWCDMQVAWINLAQKRLETNQ